MMTKEAFIALSFQYPIIIFDGECHLCDRSVQFVLKRDKIAAFRFCTLQYAKTNNLIQTKTDSVMLMDKNILYMKSKAGLKILNYLGGVYRLISFLLSVIPTTLADVVYDFIAKNRYKWFGKYDVCIIPEKRWKDRFIG
jgi:predicted DCC family thiol-disulfide oxidoreductase YuxK